MLGSFPWPFDWYKYEIAVLCYIKNLCLFVLSRIFLRLRYWFGLDMLCLELVPATEGLVSHIAHWK